MTKPDRVEQIVKELKRERHKITLKYPITRDFSVAYIQALDDLLAALRHNKAATTNRKDTR